MNGQAVALLERAREHKRAAQWHRRRARQMMAELREFCKRAGIPYEEVDDGRVREGQSHNGRRS